MAKEKSLNEKEVRDAVHARLTAKGIKCTKKIVDDVLDAATDVAIDALTSGKSIKYQGFGTIAPSFHKEKAFKTPVLENGLPTGAFHEGITPAHNRATFIESDIFIEKMNPVN